MNYFINNVTVMRRLLRTVLCGLITNYYRMELESINMCSHLKRKLFEEDGPYHNIWLALQEDNELSATLRSHQLHIYRNGKKILILAGKAAPKVLMEDRINDSLKM